MGVVLDELKECLRWSLESDYIANISPGWNFLAIIWRIF